MCQIRCAFLLLSLLHAVSTFTAPFPSRQQTRLKAATDLVENATAPQSTTATLKRDRSEQPIPNTSDNLPSPTNGGLGGSPLEDLVRERKKFELNLGRAMDILKLDYPLMLESEPDFSIYSPNLVVEDVTGEEREATSYD